MPPKNPSKSTAPKKRGAEDANVDDGKDDSVSSLPPEVYLPLGHAYQHHPDSSSPAHIQNSISMKQKLICARLPGETFQLRQVVIYILET
jgi:hypothetical protein